MATTFSMAQQPQQQKQRRLGPWTLKASSTPPQRQPILPAAAAAGGGSHKWQAGLLSVLISVAVIFTVVSGEWEGGPWNAWGRAARTDCKRAVPFQ